MQSTFLSSFFASFRTATALDDGAEVRTVTAPIELKAEELGDVGGGISIQGPAGTWAVQGPAGTW